jgi:predicted ATPase
VPSFLGIASPLGHQLPFHAWGPVFTRLCTVPEPTPTERRDGGRRLHLGDADDDLTDVRPLLNAVLPLNLPDTALTVQMTGRQREENTVRLLVRLLQRHARCTPLLIALEDAHWLDPASWALAQSVCARVARVLLVIATRSPLPASAAGHPTPLPAATTVHLPVGPLAAHDIDRLGCQCLGVAQVAEAVAAFLAERGQGHPFVTAELAASLRDAGLIAVVDEVAQFAAGVVDEGGLPDCTLVHRAIGQRSAQLSTAHQVALHIASDWGAAYAMPILQPMHGLPLEPGRWSALGELASADAYREAA